MLFRLRTAHVIEGAVRNPGTIVGPYGSGAPVVYNGEPDSDMEGADDEGASRVKELWNRLHGDDPPWAREGFTPAGVERAYAGDHPDNAKVDEKAAAKAQEALAEANSKYWNQHGTAPLETIPHPAAAAPMVRPDPAIPRVGQDVPALGERGNAPPQTSPSGASQASSGTTATPKPAR